MMMSIIRGQQGRDDMAHRKRVLEESVVMKAMTKEMMSWPSVASRKRDNRCLHLSTMNSDCSSVNTPPLPPPALAPSPGLFLILLSTVATVQIPSSSLASSVTARVPDEDQLAFAAIMTMTMTATVTDLMTMLRIADPTGVYSPLKLRPSKSAPVFHDVLDDEGKQDPFKAFRTGKLDKEMSNKVKEDVTFTVEQQPRSRTEGFIHDVIVEKVSGCEA